jgi:hypothetical protein
MGEREGGWMNWTSKVLVKLFSSTQVEYQHQSCGSSHFGTDPYH